MKLTREVTVSCPYCGTPTAMFFKFTHPGLTQAIPFCNEDAGGCGSRFVVEASLGVNVAGIYTLTKSDRKFNHYSELSDIEKSTVKQYLARLYPDVVSHGTSISSKDFNEALDALAETFKISRSSGYTAIDDWLGTTHAVESIF